MATSDFSWLKILSIFGWGFCGFFAFVNGGSAGFLISKGETFNGIGSILSAIGWLVVAYLIYKNYQKKDMESKKK